MEKEEIDKWINWMIQGLLLSLCLSMTLYLCGDRHREHLTYSDLAILFLPSIVELIISSWMVIRRSKDPSFICCVIFTIISELLIYMLSNIYSNDSYSSDYYATFDFSSLKYLVPLVTATWMAIKYKQSNIAALFNKDKTRLKAPRAISFMESLSILRLMNLLRRTSTKALESEEVDAIIGAYRADLGVNYQELDYHIKKDMNFSNKEILNAVKPYIESLRKDFSTNRLCSKCHRIVEISESKEASEIFQQIFFVSSDTKDLSQEMREAPLRLIALIAGSSPLSALSTLSDVTKEIMQKYAEKLCITPEQVAEILTNDMQREPQDILDSINYNLRALSLHFKLNNFRADCERIADISREPIAYAIIRQAFRNIHQ